MGTHDGTVNDQVLHIWIINEAGMHLLPDAVVAPASKPLVNAVPFAVFIRQQAPLRSTAGNPEHAFNEETAIGFFPDICSGVVFQKRIDLLPLFVLKGYI